MKYNISFVFVSLCLCMVSALPTEPPKPCSTGACKKAAEYLIDSMNATVNPCDNFYEYACGGWQNRKIPDDKLGIAPLLILNDKTNEDLRVLLEKFNISTESKTSAGSVAFGSYVYQQCVALGKESNETGLAALKDVVKSILGDRTWDIGREAAHSSQTEHPWNETFVKLLLAGVPNFLFVISFSKNVSNNIMMLLPNEPNGLGTLEMQNLTSNPKQVTAYKEYIRSSGKLFCGDKCNATLLDSDIDDIVKLESDLAMNRLPIELQRQFETLFNEFTFKQLKEKSKLDWLSSIFAPIQKSLGMTPQLSESSEITVTEVNFTVKALEILAKTPQRTLDNYFGWRIVAHFGPHSSEQLRQIDFEFQKVKTGGKKLKNRKEQCFQLAYSNLDIALSRIYVDHNFSEKEKKKAAELIDSIQETLHSLLELNQWLDPVTKKASLNKLSHVAKHVAYPEWLLHNDQLDEFYLLQNKTEAQSLLANKNLFMSLAKFSALQLKKVILELPKRNNHDKHWTMVPAALNAGYHYMQNSITIPALMMKSPSFDAERPFSLNYGAIGMVIAHEFTHGFDDVGRKYDVQGNLQNWWTPEALKRYNEKGQCFVQLYGSQVEKTSGLHLNGENGLGENIADNGGLHIAYKAFQAQQAKSGPSPILADLPKLTSDQLYFVAFANNFCSFIRPDGLKYLVMYDAHPPPEYRVNVPVSNSEDFSKVFKCPVGSPMNPSHKCSMW